MKLMKEYLDDIEYVDYLHNLARRTNDQELRRIADRLHHLSKYKKESDREATEFYKAYLSHG